MLRLLRLFEGQDMIRVNQAARDIGISRSTVHRMLTTLAHHQFVEQDEHLRAYQPGPALVGIGMAAGSNIGIRVISRRALITLRDAAGETSHRGVMCSPRSAA